MRIESGINSVNNCMLLLLQLQFKSDWADPANSLISFCKVQR